jgi:hypothetical protein
MYRQRFQAILDGQVPNRPLWVCRLDIWYHARRVSGRLPAEVEGMSIADIEALLGMGRSARKARVYRVEYESVEEETIRDGDRLRHTFITPKGIVSCAWFDAPSQRDRGIAKILVEPYLKSQQDYDVMCYVTAHTRYVPDYDAYRAYDAEVGDDGLPLVLIGESPIHTIMLDYAGYQNFYYHVKDWPDKVQALLEALEVSYRQMWEVVAASPARLVLHGTHFSSDMTPPPIFGRYFVPYFQAFNSRMHEVGIKVAFHADADLTGLLEMVRDCDFDVADTFACAPLVRTTFAEAREAWKDRIVIWGGVPSTILEPGYPMEAFQRYMIDLHRKTRGRSHFIMAVSDNVMPAAELGRLKWIRRLLYG